MFVSWQNNLEKKKEKCFFFSFHQKKNFLELFFSKISSRCRTFVEFKKWFFFLQFSLAQVLVLSSQQHVFEKKKSAFFQPGRVSEGK